MNPKTTPFSLFQRICHEIFRGQRELICEGVTPAEISTAIRNAESVNIAALSKVGIGFLILVVLIQQLEHGGLIVIRSPLGQIEFPIAYALFGASVNYATLGMHMLNAIVLLVVKAHDNVSGVKISRFSNAKNLLSGDGVSDIASPFRVGSLLKF